VPPAALALILLAIIAAGRERAIGGEIVAALALASMAAPVALAAGSGREAAVTGAATFSASFAVATVGVRAVIASSRRPPGWTLRLATLALAIGSLATLGWLAARGTVSPSAPWAAVPCVVVNTALACRPPSATRLRTVGWLLVA